MKVVLTIVISGAVVGVGALLYAWSGIYNIAATQPHWDITFSFIEMFRDRSVAVRSDKIQAPNLDSQKLMKAAFHHYHEMCRLCHGAPEYPPEEFAKGLYPAPLGMASGHIQEERSDGEIYWIVKHGIKLTGMPAFGPTHDEQELWGLVVLAKEMPNVSPEQYRQWVRAGNSEKEEDGHH